MFSAPSGSIVSDRVTSTDPLLVWRTGRRPAKRRAASNGRCGEEDRKRRLAEINVELTVNDGCQRDIDLEMRPERGVARDVSNLREPNHPISAVAPGPPASDAM